MVQKMVQKLELVGIDKKHRKLKATGWILAEGLLNLPNIILSTIRKFGALRLKLNYDERRFQFP